ncbi:MAG TPA: ATPase domain-containing protein [Gemmatimonadales bacterium]|nr:ATPase domain-containing protein [Gemmatimonadales bacterium]
MTDPTASIAIELLETGVAGLDEVLDGGLTSERLYLLEGDPGSGKTTLALQFLLAGARRGQRGLFVALSESAEELRSTARSHGWSLQDIEIFELVPSAESITADARYTMFHPSEVELGTTIEKVKEAVERTGATRIVFDSLSELRLLAQDSLRYRRQVLALKHFFSRRHGTVLMVDDRTSAVGDMVLFSLAHGVISLERHTPEFGVLRRRVQVPKMRGRAFREGFHDFRIRRGGLEVYPRLVASERRQPVEAGVLSSGIPRLDQLLGGGLTRGTSTLLLGPAGSGKSSISTQFLLEAARRGEPGVVYMFDESLTTFTARSSGIGLPVDAEVERGIIELRPVDPAELAPGEFAGTVRQAVEERGVKLVIIDSLNGYLHAMPEEKLLLLHMHDLLSYLGQQGVTTIMVMAQHGLLGSQMSTPVDTTYVADTVVLTRFFEDLGEVHRALSVIKKRTGTHERTIRELSFTPHGIDVGEPLRELRGILAGVPEPQHDGDQRRPLGVER